MGKHSRQANTREYFTSGERAKAKKEYGTQVSRLGAESQRKFDMCNLCMDRLAKDCVATPSGFLYCRECILKHLVASKEAIDAHRAAYEEQQKRLAAEAAAAAAAAHASVVTAFERREAAMTVAAGARAGSAAASSAAAGAATAGGVGATALAIAARKAEEEKARIAAAVVALKSHADHRDTAEKLAEARAASFWVPDATPSAADGLLPPPDPCPRDPQSGEFLRAKQLVPLRLTRANPPKTDDDDAGVASAVASSSSSSGGVAGSGAGGDAAGAAAADEPDDADATSAASGVSRFMCPTCLRGIVYQQTYLFKP